ncbi:MAG: MBL fold metallo-hydrolase [Clostridiales bacterium]|nr:MBL fold metallo-hydrolase [Clostridiales bacterium]
MNNQKPNLFAKDTTKFNQLIFKVSITLFIAIIFVVFFLSFGGLATFEPARYVDYFKNYEFQLHTIDVENGDAFLLRLPNDKVMLIDCGDSEYEDRVLSYISQFMKSENLQKIDYFILTHTDSDHIGNASAIINKFNVVNLYRPKIYSKDEEKLLSQNEGYKVESSKTYNDVILSAYAKGCNIIFNEAGLSISLSYCQIDFLSPNLNDYANDNDYSAVVMLKYFSTKILFMGDASSQVEESLIDKYGNDLQADILKIGHHGSKSSTSNEFLQAVKPKYAILSCGDNSSILPNNEVITLLENNNIHILSTMKLQNFAISIYLGDIAFKAQDAYFNYWAIIFVVLTIVVVILFKIDFSPNKVTKK